MNILAHAVLSGENEHLAVGNFIGDFVRSRDLTTLPESIVRGVELHHKIDEFMDTHPIVVKGRERLWDKYRHYNRVIIDIYYDHFLAINFTQYSAKELHDLANHFYGVIKKYWEYLPHAAREMYPYMVNHNWLVQYQDINGIITVLKGMSRRSSFVSRMDEAGGDLKAFYAEYNQEFNEFFPLIISETDAFRNT